MRKKDVLHSPRLSQLKRRRQRAIWGKILILLLGLGAIFGLLTYLSRLKRLNISEVQVTGNNIVETEAIKAAVQEEVSGYYLWLFPKTNIFFYPKNKIKDALTEKFERLKDITISIKDRKTLEVSVSERSPEYTWCGATPLATNNKTCYFLDETGYIFDVAPYFSGEIYFKFFGTVDSKDADPTGTYLSEQYFDNLIFFKEMLSTTLKLQPKSAYIADNGDVKIFLSPANPFSTTPEIMFKINSDFQQITENLQTALATEPLLTDFKKKYSSLLYIDLRFGNKVYYKFKI